MIMYLDAVCSDTSHMFVITQAYLVTLLASANIGYKNKPFCIFKTKMEADYTWVLFLCYTCHVSVLKVVMAEEYYIIANFPDGADIQYSLVQTTSIMKYLLPDIQPLQPQTSFPCCLACDCLANMASDPNVMTKTQYFTWYK